MENEDDKVEGVEGAASESTLEKPEAGVADGAALADDESRAPEEESESRLPGDPRAPHEMQPPSAVGY